MSRCRPRHLGGFVGGIVFAGDHEIGELEPDVGFVLEENSCYMCEVITHILGMGYKDYTTTKQRLVKKHERQMDYAQNHLPQFSTRFQIWSPIVPRGLATMVADIGFELIINQEYARRIYEVRRRAREMTRDVGNPAFRLLQILEHMRCIPESRKTSLSVDTVPSDASMVDSNHQADRFVPQR